MNTAIRFVIFLFALLLVFGVADVSSTFAGVPYAPSIWGPQSGTQIPYGHENLCGLNNGDPEGDIVELRVEISGPVNYNTDWAMTYPQQAYCSAPWTPLPPGNYTWIVRARDGEGESISETATFTIYDSNISYVPVQGYSYLGQLMVETDYCVIINGGQIVLNELSHRKAAIDQQTSTTDKVFYAVAYLSEVIGVVEDLRQSVEATVLSTNSNCTSPQYRVGFNLMDTSGLGNIAYGYFATYLNFPSVVQQVWADVAQRFNNQTVSSVFQGCSYNIHCTLLQIAFISDFSDDISQRNLGADISGTIPTFEHLAKRAFALGLY